VPAVKFQIAGWTGCIIVMPKRPCLL
jgi:hypothetical protein